MHVTPSTTIEPDGFVATVTDTVAGDSVVLVQVLVVTVAVVTVVWFDDVVVELKVVVVVVVWLVDTTVELEEVVVVVVTCSPVVNVRPFSLLPSFSSTIWLSGSTIQVVVWVPACAVSGPTYQVCTSPGAMLSGPPRP